MCRICECECERADGLRVPGFQMVSARSLVRGERVTGTWQWVIN